MTIIVLAITGAVLAVLMSGFYSGSETGMYCVDRLRLRIDSERGDHRAARIARMLDHEHNALSAMLMGTNISNYFATVLVADLFSRTLGVHSGASELYTTAVVTPVIFVFGEVFPKTLYQRHADALMRAGAFLLHLSMYVLYVPVTVLNRTMRPLVRLIDPGGLVEAADPRRKIASLLQGALADQDDEGDHLAYVDRVFGLSTISLHQVMVPRNRVVSIHGDAQRKELMTLARRWPHSRLLVYDRAPRRITGYVLVDELLTDKNWTQVHERARRVVELAANDSVATALVRLQNAREAIAVVTDRNGLLLGLVTLKDLLEELTGELPEW